MHAVARHPLLALILILGTQIRETANILQSSFQEQLLLLHDRDSEFAAINWFYQPDPVLPCDASRYRVDSYTKNQINVAQDQTDLIYPFYSQEISENSISAHLIRNSTFFLITALGYNSRECAKTKYYYYFESYGK